MNGFRAVCRDALRTAASLTDGLAASGPMHVPEAGRACSAFLGLNFLQCVWSSIRMLGDVRNGHSKIVLDLHDDPVALGYGESPSRHMWTSMKTLVPDRRVFRS